MLRRRVHGRERAFTVIEMIVVMILMGITMAVMGRMLIDKLAGQQKTVTTQRAVAAGNEVVGQLGDDLRAARSPDRDAAKIGDPDRLRDAVLSDAAITDATNSSVTLDVRDVLVAEPTRLQFRSDAISEPAGAPKRIECVTYQVVSDGSLWRVVNDFNTASRNCTGALRLQTRLMPSPNP